MWKESSMERGYDCQDGDATVEGHDVKEHQQLVHYPLLSSPLLSPLTFTDLGIVWTSLIDRARGTGASAVWHDDPQEHHVVNLPRRRCSRRGEIIEAATIANILKFISSLLNGCNTRVGRQGEPAVLWAETKDWHCMYIFFSFIFFCDFWFLIFDYYFYLLIY